MLGTPTAYWRERQVKMIDYIIRITHKLDRMDCAS